MQILNILLVVQLLKISIIDVKAKKIRNIDIIILYHIGMAYLFMMGESIVFIGIRNIVALFFLAISYKYWKHGIGAGDVKLICVGFIILGAWKICFVCVLSLLLLFLYIGSRYQDKKEWKTLYIPLAPFICSSIYILLLL